MPQKCPWCWILLVDGARGELVCHSDDCIFVSVSYADTQLSSPVTALPKKLVSCVDCSNKSPTLIFLHSIWSSESNRGTNFAQTGRMSKSSYRIACTEPTDNPTQPYLDTTASFGELSVRSSYIHTCIHNTYCTYNRWQSKNHFFVFRGAENF
jgi:hypothetical protein